MKAQLFALIFASTAALASDTEIVTVVTDGVPAQAMYASLEDAGVFGVISAEADGATIVQLHVTNVSCQFSRGENYTPPHPPSYSCTFSDLDGPNKRPDATIEGPQAEGLWTHFELNGIESDCAMGRCYNEASDIIVQKRIDSNATTYGAFITTDAQRVNP